MSYTINDIAGVASVKVNQLDLVANNIANAATPGYKTEHIKASVGDNVNDPTNDQVPEISATVYVDFSQGVLEKTGNYLDLALQGEGFFEVETPEGRAYTRAGNFTINRDGTLTDQLGNPVMGESGQITIAGEDTASDVRISQSGMITVYGTEAEGAEVATLKVVSFDNPDKLKRGANGLFVDPGQAGLKTLEAEQKNIQSGYLEMSNASATKEMIQLMDIQRTFELYQKAIQTISEQDRLAVSRVGRLA
ncbi:MAG: flagellar basal-body rod protein FlgF [Syntrophaceae bacterium]|nr:flagellar basal-body rod protein FlgF [Syntrophaceae bacterium]